MLLQAFVFIKVQQRSSQRYDLIPDPLRQKDKKYLLICDGIRLITRFCYGVKGQHDTFMFSICLALFVYIDEGISWVY